MQNCLCPQPPSISSAQKYNRVLKYLRSKILAAEPGMALPGIRQVMSDCGVGQLIVQRAVEQLRNEGALEASPRRGIFKSRKATQPTDLMTTLDVIYCADEESVLQMDGSNHRPRNSFHGELLQELTRICGQRWQGVRVGYLGRGREMAAFEEVVDRKDCNACILVTADRSDLEDAVFAPRHVPVVHMLPSAAEVPASSVVVDAHQVVAAQLKHLWDLGHKRIGYLHLVEPGRYHRTLVARREEYYRLMAERGLPVRSDWVRFGGWDSRTTARASPQ